MGIQCLLGYVCMAGIAQGLLCVHCLVLISDTGPFSSFLNFCMQFYSSAPLNKLESLVVVTDGHLMSGLLIELDLEDLGHSVIQLSKMWEPKCLQVLRRNYAAWVASVMAVWKFWLERSGCSIRWREMYCSLPLDIASFFIDLCIESHSQNAGGGFGKKILQDIGGTEPWVGSVLNEIWLWVGSLLLATTNLTAIILQISALSTVLCSVQVTWILNPPSLTPSPPNSVITRRLCYCVLQVCTADLCWCFRSECNFSFTVWSRSNGWR